MIDTTLAELWCLFETESCHLSPHTLQTYSADLTAFITFHNQMESRPATTSDLTVAKIEACMARIVGQGKSRATANRVLRGITVLWAWGYKRGYAERPMPIKRFKELVRQPEAWRPEEFDSIVQAARRLPGMYGQRPAALVAETALRLLFNTGARLRACLAIRCEWVDMQFGTVKIDATVQKDGETQTADMLPETVRCIVALDPFGRLDRILGDWPYAPRAFDELLRRLIVSAGLRPTTSDVTRRDLAHKIRRTYATQLYAATGDIEYTRQKLGHSSIETTRRYIDWSQIPRKGEREFLREPRGATTQLRLFG